MRSIRSLFKNSSDRFTVMNCMRMSNGSGDLEVEEACESASEKCNASNEPARDENRSLHKFKRARSSFNCDYRFTIKNKVAGLNVLRLLTAEGRVMSIFDIFQKGSQP